MIDWNDNQITLMVYVISGISFLVMFLAMTLWKNRISHIELMNDFRYLAIFALLQGLTELTDIPRYLTWQPVWVYDLIRLILTTSSFTALLAFGIFVISAGAEEYRWLRGMPFGAVWMYIWLIIFIGLDFTNNNIGINYRIADLAQRYALGFLGALISSYAFFDLSKKIKEIAGNEARRRFIYAGLAFALYTVFGGLIVNPVLDIPVVVYRSAISILITLTVIGIFHLFEVKKEVDPA